MAADEATPEDVPGYVDPDPGTDSPAESEIPVGVDALTDDQIAQAEEAGPVGGDEGDGGALDVSALMEEGGGDDAAAEGDATPDDDVGGPTAADEQA